MFPDNYIKLPNGKKIYLKDVYGSVSKDAVEKKSHAFSLFRHFDENFSGKLDSGEVKSIFDSLKECANSDGNNELSDTELNMFIKKHVEDKYTLSLIKPKEVIKFLLNIQKESDKSLKGKSIAKAANTISEIFPELDEFELGPDNNIDLSKFSNEELKKHYSTDKYEIRETVTATIYAPDGSKRSVTRILEDSSPSVGDDFYELTIINKETGEEVLTKSEDLRGDNSFKIKLTDEKSGNKIIIGSSRVNKDLSYIESSDDKMHIDIRNSKVEYVHQVDSESYYDEDGIIAEKRIKGTVITYKNGKEVKEAKQPQIGLYKIYKLEHEDISSQLEELIKNNNSAKFLEYIEKSITSNDIGLDMDNYYALTGRELIDDINKSNFPNNIKEDLYKRINSPFVDSIYYDAHKKIENEHIENDYYVSEDLYSVEYNGAIINIYNKTTGNQSRINLRTLLKDYDLSKKDDLEAVLYSIQLYSPEMLENLSVEIDTIMNLTKENSKGEYDSIISAGFYTYDTITDGELMLPSLISHELGHAMDDNADHEYLSAKGKFKEIYDFCIKRYEAKGLKRFDNQNPNKNSRSKYFKGDNYATYNEREAFAIGMQILMGFEDSCTEFIHDQMPELIDATKELYLEIRKRPQQERRRI